MKQENGGADWLDQKECLGCRITYSIYSNFPPMPSARAYNVETGEFFPFDRLRSLPNGYEMAKAQGLAWTCNCRGRSRTPPQNLGNAQPFGYKPLDAPNGDAETYGGMPIENGPPNTGVENPSGSGQLRLYDANGNVAVDIDFDHDHGLGAPHSHNWDGGSRDLGNAVSILPY